MESGGDTPEPGTQFLSLACWHHLHCWEVGCWPVAFLLSLSVFVLGSVVDLLSILFWPPLAYIYYPLVVCVVITLVGQVDIIAS